MVTALTVENDNSNERFKKNPAIRDEENTDEGENEQLEDENTNEGENTDEGENTNKGENTDEGENTNEGEGENTDEGEGENTDEGENADPGKLTPSDRDTSTGTSQPSTPTVPQNVPIYKNPWFYAFLAVVAALAVWALVKKLMKRREPPVTVLSELKPREETLIPTANLPPEAPETTGVTKTISAMPVGAMQHIGNREDQQDSYGISPLNDTTNGFMAVVADGMGGLSNGKLVSSTVVRCFLECYRDMAASKNSQELLLESAIRANAQINQLLRGAARSGSTLVAAMIRGDRLHFLTVGDSRIYLYRGGALLQLNREHIYQEELMVKAVNRTVSVAQVTGDRQAHALTSYFGIGQIPHIDRNDIGIKLIPGDKLLLASDGVFGTLSQEQMEQAMALPPDQAAQTMKELVLDADRPHQDNNTALVVEYR